MLRRTIVSCVVFFTVLCGASNLQAGLNLANDEAGLFLYGWGQNQLGQLTADGEQDAVAEREVLFRNAKDASASILGIFYIDEDGVLWGLGNGFSIENPREDGFSRIAEDVVSLDAGYGVLLYQKEDGSLWLNGWYNTVSEKVSDGASFYTAGVFGYMFVEENGDLYGSNVASNDTARLGLGHLSSVDKPTFIASNVVYASLGPYNGAFVTENGDLYAMGAGWGRLFGDAVQNWWQTQPAPVWITEGVETVNVADPYTMYYSRRDGNLYQRDSGVDSLLLEGVSEIWVEPGYSWAAAPRFATGGPERSFVWGNQNYGEFGLGSWSGMIEEPTELDYGVKRFATFQGTGVFFLENGNVEVSGYRGYDLRLIQENQRPRLAGLSDVTSVNGDTHATLFVDSEGALWLAGQNIDGHFVPGGEEIYAEPVKIWEGVKKAILTPISGYSGMFVLEADGDLYKKGQFNFVDFNEDDPTEPVLVAEGVKDVSFSRNGSTLYFVGEDNILYGMGDNFGGQLGIEDTDTWVADPIAIATDVDCVSAGSNFVAYLSTGGDLYTLGTNDYGQIGVDDDSVERVIDPYMLASNVVDVATNFSTLVYLLDDGRAFGVGGASNAQLGVPPDESGAVHTPVQLGSGIVDVSIQGGYNVQLLDEEGVLWVRGYGFGASPRDLFGEDIYDPLVADSKVTSLFSAGVSSAFYKRSDSLSLSRRFVQAAFDADESWYGFEDEVEVRSPRSWTGTTEDDWITLEVTQGGVGETDLKFSVAANNSMEPRYGYIDVDGNLIQVRQEGVPFLEVAGIGMGGTIDGDDYQMEGDADWLRFEFVEEASAVNVIVELNDSGEAREASFLIDGKRYYVRQAAMEPVASSLFTMGSNRDGQLGNGATIEQGEPEFIDTEVIFMAAGRGFTLYVTEDGTLYRLGGSPSFDSSNSSIFDPKVLDTGVSQVLASGNHFSYLKQDGSLYWHSVDSWLLDTHPGDYDPVLVDTDVRQMSMGGNETLYVKNDDTLWGFGQNWGNQLGMENGGTDVGAPVQIDEDVLSVSTAQGHSVYLKLDRTLWGMGTPWSIAIVQGDYESDFHPPVQIDSNVGSFETGDNITVYVKDGEDGFWFLGIGEGLFNYTGAPVQQLWNGFALDSELAVFFIVGNEVKLLNLDFELFDYLDASLGASYELDDVGWISSGSEHNLLLRASNGDLLGVGKDYFGQAGGDGEPSDLSVPGLVASDVKGIGTLSDAGYYINSFDQLWGMGRFEANPNAQNTGGFESTMPVLFRNGVEGIFSSQASGLNDESLVFRKTDGGLVGLGDNTWSQFGGLSVDDFVISDLSLFTDIEKVAVDDDFIFYLEEDGDLFVAGRNSTGAFGDEVDQWEEVSTLHQVMSGIKDVTTSRSTHSLFLGEDGVLWGAGHNYSGQLGVDLNVDNGPFFDAVQIATGVEAIAQGFGMTYYINEANELWGLGSSDRGQVGYDSQEVTGQMHVARKIDDEVVRVSSGLFHVLYEKGDGTLWGLGANEAGQLGTGDFVDRFEPEKLFDEVAGFEAGPDYSMVLLDPLAGLRSLSIGSEGGELQLPIWVAGSWSVSEDLNWVEVESPLDVEGAATVELAVEANPYPLTRVGVVMVAGIPVRIEQGRVDDFAVFEEDELEVSAAGGVYDVQLYANMAWSLSVSDDWFEVVGETTGSGSKVIQISVSPSRILAEREGYLMVGGHEIAIVQAAQDLFAGVDVLGGSYLIDGTQVTDDVYPEWIRFERIGNSNKGYVFVDENEGDEPREGSIEIDGKVYYFAQEEAVVGNWTLYSFGDSSYGQRGDGLPMYHDEPELIADGIVDAGLGDGFTMYLDDEGTLWRLGDADIFDRSMDSKFSPQIVDTDVVEIAVGAYQYAYIKADGSLWWISQQDSAHEDLNAFDTTPIKIADDVKSVGLSETGASAVLYINDSDELWGFGQNWYGILGLGINQQWLIVPPTKIADGVKALDVGETHSVFVKLDGTLWGMGGNWYTQLGPTGDYTSPVQMDTDVRLVEASSNSTLYVKNDGTIWGRGASPVGVWNSDDPLQHTIDGVNGNDIVELVFLADSEGVLLANGTLYSLAGEVLDTDYALRVDGADHSIFLDTEGVMVGMGLDQFGQSGLDRDMYTGSIPMPVANRVYDFGVGATMSYYLDYDGRLNIAGLFEVGPNDGRLYFSSEYGEVDQDVDKIFVNRNPIFGGLGYSVVYKREIWDSNTLYSLGYNGDEQALRYLKDAGQYLDEFDSSIAMGTDVEISASVVWVLGPGGELIGGGRQIYGLLGDTVDDYENPIDPVIGNGQDATTNVVILDTDVAQISLGVSHGVYVKNDGSLWGLGGNWWGALGVDPEISQIRIPVKIADNVVSASAGFEATAFIDEDGKLWGLGMDLRGWTGEAVPEDPDPITTPRLIAENVVKAELGDEFLIYQLEDGSLWGLGRNHVGQLGQGDAIDRSEPVQIFEQVEAFAVGREQVLVAVDALDYEEPLEFGAAGGERTLEVDVMGDWYASSYVPWISFPDGQTGEGMDPLKIAVAANESPVSRVGVMTMNGVFIRIEQAAAASYISIAQETVEFEAAGGVMEIDIFTNRTWSVTESSDWISIVGASIGTGDATVRISAAENELPVERSATVTIGGIDILVTQKTEAVGFYIGEGTVPSAFAADEASTGYAGLWLPDGEETGKIVGVCIEGDTSTGFVYDVEVFSQTKLLVTISEDETILLTKNQLGMYAGVLPCIGPIEFEKVNAADGEASSEFTGFYEADSGDQSGAKIFVFVAPNGDTIAVAPQLPQAFAVRGRVSATGSIVVSQEGAPTAKTLKLASSGGGSGLSLKPTSISDDYERIDSSGTSISLDVDSIGSWTVSESLDWASVDVSQGDGSMEIEVTVNENTGMSLRVGEITIGTESFTIRQLGNADGLGFDDWLRAYFTAEEVTAMGDSPEAMDVDYDGSDNETEWLLELDPDRFGSRLIQDATVEDGMLLIGLNVAPPSGVAYEVEVTEDFETWTAVEGAMTSGEDDLPEFSFEVEVTVVGVRIQAVSQE